MAATMCMGPKGDAAGIPVGECAVRMARAGTNLVKKPFKSKLIRAYAKLFSRGKEGRRVAKPIFLRKVTKNLPKNEKGFVM